MTAVPPVGEAAPPDAADPLAPYRRWATVLFAILAAVGIFAAAVVLGNVRIAAPLFVVLVAGVVVSVGAFLLLAVAIADRRPWAIHAIAPTCYVVVLFGAIRAALSLAQGDILLPLEAFGALMVLSRPHGRDLLPPASATDRRAVGGLVAALVLSTVLPAAASSRDIDQIIGGGPDALRLAVAIDCSAVRSDPAAAIPIRVDWWWATRPLSTGAEDGLVVRWDLSTDQLDDGDVINGVFKGEQRVSAPDAIASGAGSPSATLTEPIVAGGPSWTFLIDVPNHGFFDGWVEVPIGVASQLATHGSLQAWAAYANGDRWLKESDVASCTW